MRYQVLKQENPAKRIISAYRYKTERYGDAVHTQNLYNEFVNEYFRSPSDNPAQFEITTSLTAIEAGMDLLWNSSSLGRKLLLDGLNSNTMLYVVTNPSDSPVSDCIYNGTQKRVDIVVAHTHAGSASFDKIESSALTVAHELVHGAIFRTISRDNCRSTAYYDLLSEAAARAAEQIVDQHCFRHYCQENGRSIEFFVDQVSAMPDYTPEQKPGLIKNILNAFHDRTPELTALKTFVTHVNTMPIPFGQETSANTSLMRTDEDYADSKAIKGNRLHKILREFGFGYVKGFCDPWIGRNKLTPEMLLTPKP